MSEQNDAPSNPAEIPFFKFEEEQICRIVYNPKINVFIVGRQFDTKVKKNFYHGRVFTDGKIEFTITRFVESELEGILTKEQEEELNKKYPQSTELPAGVVPGAEAAASNP
jgi:hypothetical protein